MSQTSSRAPARKPRCLTASQIAKNTGHFDQWAQYQNLVVGSYHKDLPAELKNDVEGVFNVSMQLPEAWVNPVMPPYKKLAQYLDPDFVVFLKSAKASTPSLFSKTVEASKSGHLLRDLHNVFLAFRRLGKSRDPVTWSESDWAAQVYNVLRISVGHASDNRSHCSISLPQPLSEHKMNRKAASNLDAKTIRPDGALFVPADELAELSDRETSLFNRLARHRNANNASSHGGTSSFKWQSTLCSQLPSNPGFEVASAFWEDKKPEQKVLDVAYRQNRMATTAALRQLHSLHIEAPIFGLVWADGKVRWHVDWWKEENDEFTIVSAPYPGPHQKGQKFHEWDLSKAADIIEVYLLLRNLDQWTVDGFQARVVTGINKLAKAVITEDRKVVQWRRRRSVGGKGGRTEEAAEEPEQESISSPVKTRRRAKQAKAKRRTLDTVSEV